MKIRYLVACGLVSACMGASAADVTMFRTSLDTAQALACFSGGCAVVTAQSGDNFTDGTMYGTISILLSNQQGPVFFQIINCEGPEFADALVLNHANGNTSIKVTVAPSMPGCRGVNFLEPVTVDLVGRFDGNVHQSIDGFNTIESNTLTLRTKMREDRFTAEFQGTVGPVSGIIFNGSLAATRNSRLEQAP